MAHRAKNSEHTPDAPVSPRVQTAGQFRKCDKCGESLFIKELQKSLEVCKQCGHHFKIGALRRLEVTLDPGSFSELFDNLESADPLQFKAKGGYPERIREAQRKTGLKDAVVCGVGLLDDQSIVVAAMDFQFIGGSMGSVVGEKITRAIEHATAKRSPIIIFCCSGGARMHEGAFSLMQMAKTSAALHRHDKAGAICITVLTDPTLAGVSASFAFLGDIIIAEPKAMIGFTGSRVIEQTIRKKLPEDFQKSEFLLEHGQIDMVVERKDMRDMLSRLISFAAYRPVEMSRRKTLEPSHFSVLETNAENTDKFTKTNDNPANGKYRASHKGAHATIKSKRG